MRRVQPPDGSTLARWRSGYSVPALQRPDNSSADPVQPLSASHSHDRPPDQGAEPAEHHLHGLVLGILAFLFITIGLVSQIAGVLKGLILDARRHLQEGSAVERSAQAISIAIYAGLWLPFWLIQLPFSFIGSLLTVHRFGALVTVAVFLAVIDAIAFYSSQIIRLLHSF